MPPHLGRHLQRHLPTLAAMLGLNAVERPNPVGKKRFLSESFLQDLATLGRLRARTLIDRNAFPKDGFQSEAPIKIEDWLEARFVETAHDLGEERSEELYLRFTQCTFSDLAIP